MPGMVSRGKLFEAETTEHLEEPETRNKTVNKSERWVEKPVEKVDRYAFLEAGFGDLLDESYMSLLSFC